METYKSLTDVLTDRKLASLGDAYVNFIHSLALSNKTGKPSGSKVKGHVLAEALKKAGLRKHLPSRMTQHTLADAAESLVVYGWLTNALTLDEAATLLEKADDAVEGFSQLLIKTKNRVSLP